MIFVSFQRLAKNCKKLNRFSIRQPCHSLCSTQLGLNKHYVAIIIIDEIKTKFFNSHGYTLTISIVWKFYKKIEAKIKVMRKGSMFVFNLDFEHSVSAFKFEFGLKKTFTSLKIYFLSFRQINFLKIHIAQFDHMFDLICGNFFDLKRDKARPGKFWLETARNTLFDSFERLSFFFWFSAVP